MRVSLQGVAQNGEQRRSFIDRCKQQSLVGAEPQRGPSPRAAGAPVLTARQGVMEEGSPSAIAAAFCAASSPQKLRRVAPGKGRSQAKASMRGGRAWTASAIEARSFRIVENGTGHLYGDFAARHWHIERLADPRASVSNHGECD